VRKFIIILAGYVSTDAITARTSPYWVLKISDKEVPSR
jgi:hypothetical protein